MALIDGNTTKSIQSAVADDRQGELERFAGALIEQHEALNYMEQRLELVSERNLQEPEPPIDTAHLSSLISLVENNNRRIRRLSSELVI